MNEMLGIRQDRDISEAVSGGHMVTEQEANALLHSESGMAANLQFMRPFWASITSAYNERLFSIFWPAFTEKNPGFAGDKVIGEKYFKQRLKTLRSLISSFAPVPGETEEQTAERIEANYLVELERSRGRKRKWEVCSLSLSLPPRLTRGVFEGLLRTH